MYRMQYISFSSVRGSVNSLMLATLFILLIMPIVACDGDDSSNPVPDPECLVNPTNLVFGLVPVEEGIYSEVEFTITNTGGGILSGTLSESCGAYSIVSSEIEYDLSAGDSIAVRVRFEPSTIGIFNCIIETGANCSNVTLEGEGVPDEVRP